MVNTVKSHKIGKYEERQDGWKERSLLRERRKKYINGKLIIKKWIKIVSKMDKWK